MLSKINILDNSGGVLGRVIRIMNKKNKLSSGNLVLLSILSRLSKSKISKGSLHKGIIIKDKGKGFHRYFNSKRGVVLVRIKDNEIIPVGSRMKSFISSKLKNVKGGDRIVNMTKRSI